MELVAYLGTDKENWGQLTALINRFEWDKIFIIRNKNAGEFTASKECAFLDVNSEKPLIELKKEIMDDLRNRLGGFEVALSIASGNGKEHMALISALLSIPVGIRLVVFTKEGIEFIN